jgi:hypothetical protein
VRNHTEILGLVLPIGNEGREILEFQNGGLVLSEGQPGVVLVVLRANRQQNAALL